MSERSLNKSSRVLPMFDTIDASGLNESIRVKRKQRSLAKIPFVYPEVEIIPLHLINTFEDIKITAQKMSLEQFFKLYFRPEIDHTSR
jgi:hypothetical protein